MIPPRSNSILVNKHDVDSLACLTGNSVHENVGTSLVAQWLGIHLPM